MKIQKDFKNEIGKECDKLKELLIAKNKMYGDSFFKTLDEYGNALICVRIEDKLNRLKQIILNGVEDFKTGERLVDTLTDIAGYALLSKIYLNNQNNQK